MLKYAVLPKNPACQSPVVEADGYEWKMVELTPLVERLVFWRANIVVATENGEILDEQGMEIVPGAVLQLPSGREIKNIPITVAEFAVDWVAGVITEQGG